MERRRFLSLHLGIGASTASGGTGHALPEARADGNDSDAEDSPRLDAFVQFAHRVKLGYKRDRQRKPCDITPGRDMSLTFRIE